MIPRRSRVSECAKEILASYARGVSIYNIGRNIGVTDGHVRDFLKRSGVYVAKRQQTPPLPQPPRMAGHRSKHRARRRCLGPCQSMFDSNSIGNRLCGKCSQAAAFRSSAMA